MARKSIYGLYHCKLESCDKQFEKEYHKPCVPHMHGDEVFA